MKITIYSLEGCPSCESLKNKLNERSIPFIDVKCNEHESMCDTVEGITNCEIYPIIKVGLEYGQELFVCIAKDHNQLGNTVNYNNSKIFYIHSIDNMIDAINKM
jgi:glutaredoxin